MLGVSIPFIYGAIASETEEGLKNISYALLEKCNVMGEGDYSIENGIYPFYVRSERIERINSYSFDGEAILTPGDGDIGGIFHYINGKFDFHQRVYKYSNLKNYNGKYSAFF